LRHQTLVIRRLVARMGVLKRLPMVGKDLLEDTPVPRGCCQHRIAPSWGDQRVAVQRLYHTASASSTPHQSVLGHPHPTCLSLHHGDLGDWENAFSYTIEIVTSVGVERELNILR